MTDTLQHPPGTTAPLGLFARVVGVLMSPKATYPSITAHPRSLGVLLLGLFLVCAPTFIFLSTTVGQDAVIDQNYRVFEQMESFGMRMPDEAYAGIEEGAAQARYWAVATTAPMIALTVAAIAGIVIVIFNFVLGGEGTYRQAFAIVAHAGLVFGVGTLFATPLNYVKGSMASRANLGLLTPFLPDTSFFARLLGFIDLFWVWFLLNLAIGLGVLYKRKTGPIATTFLVIYGIVALVVAAVLTFSGA
jgi:hypothetical protein